ncbi:MAG: 2-oxo acid dehydrogenase subunit E2 [Desulfobacterales bacterium]|nr:2-oxo acid dehydrogenase subunit E2 [Desulfobacterales bacterium]
MAIEKILIPDFGDIEDISVTDVYVAAGDAVKKEDPLVGLESEKAVMDIPSPYAGTLVEVFLSEGDTVKTDDLIASIDVAGAAADTAASAADAAEDAPAPEPAPPAAAEPSPAPAPDPDATAPAEPSPAPPDVSHATPSVRAYAREQGVDLATVSGSGPKGRILKADVERATAPAAPAGRVIAEKPLEDFSVYGPVEEVALGRIQKISGPHLHHSWATIPHVTHFDEADITELEKFRQQVNAEAGTDGPKYSPLVFVIKAVAATLKAFPLFNCSLVPGGERLILKKYYNIGIAVDTPNGLVVPVVKDADRKGIREMALDLKALSEKARAGKLAIPDIRGGTFTISSLGGIGGTGFTPIISSPEVAILGLSRSYQKPVWDGEAFQPRLTLPLSLSYDHRVIDGAEAARFCRALGRNIEDLRRTLL